MASGTLVRIPASINLDKRDLVRALMAMIDVRGSGQQSRKVLVYRSSVLPLSETFIKEQMLAYRRWRGTLVGMRRVAAGLSLDGLNVLLLRSDRAGLFERIYWKANRMMGTVPLHARKRLRHEGASILHVHFGPDALEAWPLAQALDVPMLVTLHGYDINTKREWWEAGHAGQAMRNYPARLKELGQQPRVRFIAVSDAIRRRAVSYGIPENKISVRYMGVDPGKFATSGRPITERGPRVLFVGRLVEKKGCEYLIRAFARVQQIVPDALLVIVGDGHLREQLRLLAQQVNVRALFRAALSSNEVRQELGLARVFCAPSTTAANGDAEGLPIVLLEAQASGVPVVTSIHSGAPEAIRDGVTGFLCKERDVDSLAEKLIVLLRDDRPAHAMSVAAAQWVSQAFDIHSCTSALESHYDELARADTPAN
jgi:glycosyltransferase involved in cell wall biosynthesis